MALTDTSIRTLKPDAEKPEKLVADVNGLYMRVRRGKGGFSRTWQHRRKQGGRIAVTTLGSYPDLSLKDARLKAAELATKRSTFSPTVAEAAEQWLTERVDGRLKNAEPIRSYVERVIIPELGSRRVRDVEPADVGGIVRAFRDQTALKLKAKAGGRPAARALLGLLKMVFGYCVANGWIARSPAAQITVAIVGGPDKARARVLSDDEIKVVLKTDAAEGPVLRFLLATGLRIGEAYNGYREGQHWVVPSTASKNKKEHRVWLSNLALAQLEAHPWNVRKFHVQHWLTANAGGWTAHDLRRTFATRNNDAGVAPYVVEKMLNHSMGGVMGTYNRAEYLTERQDALDAWSAWLLALVTEQPAAVIPLRRDAAR